MKNLILIPILCFVSFLHAYDDSWNGFKKSVLSYQEEIPGWCSSEKAEKMMDLIYQVKPDLCVEIGVFGGASFIPTASALKYLKKGKAIGIDSWSNQDCIRGYKEEDLNYRWWNQVDLKQPYNTLRLMFLKFHLYPYCKCLRLSSENAVSYFSDESIDILHIDGNHSEESALADVKMYIPKVKKGGYIWMNDADWESSVEAVSYLFDLCELDLENSYQTKCLLFKKN